jgi:hypothetical protein
MAKAKPMAQLVDDIRKANLEPSSGTATSYPIPVRADGQVLVAAFEYETGYDATQRTNVYGPPSRVRFFDAQTGKLAREEPRKPGTALGSEAFNVPPTEYRALLDELHGAADVLLPAFARREAEPTPEIRAAAKRYKHAFDRLCPKVLVPAYREIGPDWLRWIDDLAAS